ncbi:MAG: hypothetical protein HKP58_15185 [Desulfatitalea sp.]|nr:hypothetical protein [Desulfatitalea sp.]NNK01753.1 hypothetical protein [Desulfatitalea sp.]
MGRMTPEVLMGELSLMWQDIFNWASWSIVLVMLIIAWRMGVRQKTPFYVFAILAVGAGAFIEPLYDVAFDLWFFDVHDGQPGAMVSHFTAFGVIQPIWAISGYIILYAMACLYAGRMMFEGRVTMPIFILIWFAEIFASCVFEVIGTGVGMYTYYGPYVLRIWNYPLVIAFLEGTQVILFTVVAVQWWQRVTTPLGLAGLFVIFPVTFLGTNCGIGGPLVIALHLSEDLFSQQIIWSATLLTMGLCTLAVIGAYRFLPKAAARTAQSPDLINHPQTVPA